MCQLAETCHADTAQSDGITSRISNLGSSSQGHGTERGHCCVSSALQTPVSILDEIHPHHVALMSLRQLHAGNVCASHIEPMITRAWYHATRILKLSRTAQKTAGTRTLSDPQLGYAILLALEVWTLCAPLSDVTDRRSQWNTLAYDVGLNGLSKLPEDDVDAQSRSRNIMKRLSAVWSLAMLQRQPSGKRAFFVGPKDPVAGQPWGFLLDANRIQCLRLVFPSLNIREEDDMIMVNVTEL